ncbi:hypothetical protein M3Y97_00709800 [Aphelenchoides bicaudatus]|nr:hypothetical protein M3Y97_00709800 [Aphelenchoides bicaudatus]
MSSPIVEQCLRQKFNAIQSANVQLSQEREKLWSDEQKAQEQIYELVNKQTTELRAREKQLLNELSTKMKTEESKLQKKQQHLFEAIATYEQALQSIHSGNGQQINEAMLKLNNLKLESTGSSRIEFEANTTQCTNAIHSLGHFKTSCDTLASRRLEFDSFNDEVSVSDDDFEVVNETDSTTIESSSLDSVQEIKKKPAPFNPSFQEHIKNILASPTQKWLLNAGTQSNVSASKPIKFAVHKIQKHKLNGPKTSQSFDEVIRSIQHSSNNKWLRQFQASCPEVVQNVSHIFGKLMSEPDTKESPNVTKWLHRPASRHHSRPLIMHHV